MAAKALWLGAALVSVVTAAATAAVAAAPQITAPPAPIHAFGPEAPPQVIIDPEILRLGSPSDYLLPGYSPKTPVAPGAAAVATGSSNTPGLAAGDRAMIFSGSVAGALRKTADNTIAACSLKKRDLSKRLDSFQCMVDAAVKASGKSGPLDAVMTDAFWDELGPLLATNVPEYLANALAVVVTKAQRNKVFIIIGSIIVGTKVAGPITMLKLPQAGATSPADSGNKSKCDPSTAANENSPLCSESDCKGNSDSPKCTAGKHNGCACLLLGIDGPPQIADQPWWDSQQQIFASFAANPNLLGTAAPSCSVNSYGNAFDGKPFASPASWCVCKATGVGRIYPTIASASSPCAFTTMPTATISPTITVSKGGPVTSCRTSTVTGTGAGTGPYCTCNDNSMYNVDTWTQGTKTVTGCSATRTTKAASPTNTVTATCNPPQPFTIKQEQLLLMGDSYCSNAVKSGATLNPDYYNRYDGGTSTYGMDWGCSDGAQLYVHATLDKGCTKSLPVKKADCRAAFQMIYDQCDVGQSSRQGGSAAINCQRYHITAVKKT